MAAGHKRWGWLIAIGLPRGRGLGWVLAITGGVGVGVAAGHDVTKKEPFIGLVLT